MNQSVRRELKFENLNDAVADAEHLLAAGYTPVGNWDLSQICQHLAIWMSYPVDGPPRLPFPMNVTAKIMRYTIGPGWLRKTLKNDHWPDKVPTDKRTIPPAGDDAKEAIATLKNAVDRLQNHNGELHASPIFGSLDKEEWLHLHRLHAAHHLSFLVPKD